MGTELLSNRIKDEEMDFPAVPPGFESFTSFKLIKVEKTEREASCSPCLSQQSVDIKIEPDHEDARLIAKSLRCRPWINYGQFNNKSDEERDSEQLDQSIPTKTSLPKGVIRGCPECESCQKVLARCHPEAACRPNLEEVPAFYPTEEEFEDTINYIAKIRPKAEPYGICRIIPPPSWKPPCRLKEKSIWENSEFATRIQRVDKLQNRNAARRMSKASNLGRKKRRRCLKTGVDCGAGSENILDPAGSGFGFEPGPEFTLDAFQRFADDFKAQYFRDLVTNRGTEADMSDMPKKPDLPVEIIEGEYWRVVENPTDEIEVLYGADLETGIFGSGFLKPDEQGSPSDERYIKSGWNLNNLSRLPGSVLTYENPDISGVQVPWLYIGMCFSSFCWHVEDHYLYSLNYMHFGAPKLWYGVPGKEASRLEDAMRKHLPELFDEQPDLLHKLVTQLSPSILKSEGVPIYRCVQHPGEFVLTFPRAYHAGFNCGFNCAEAVNVAPLDWFPHGQNAVELYREQGRKTTISHDKLLLGAAMEAVKANWELNLLRKNTMVNLKWKDACGRDGILAKSLRARVDMERVRRDFLCKSSKALKMLSSFDATIERECSVCFFDLHLSAAACRCSPDRYACLNHAKQFCACAWSDKFFLFRYDMNELDLLVEAINGKLSAIYKWARSYLGFSLSSCVSKDIQDSGLIGLLSSHSEELLSKEATVHPSKQASAGVSKKSLTSPGRPSELMAAAKDTQLTAGNLTDSAVLTGNKFRIKKEVSKVSSSDADVTDIQQTSATAEKPEVKRPSVGQDVICLSDDEGEQLSKPSSGYVGQSAPVLPACGKELDLSNSKLTRDAKRAGGSFSNMHINGERSIHSSASVSVEPMSVQAHLPSHQAPAAVGARINEDAKVNEAVYVPSNLNASAQIVAGDLNEQQSNNKTKDGTCVQKVDMMVVENAGSHPGSPSCSQNNLDKYFRQKGPRIAKVVRRINCNVEAMEFGAVVSEKLWSTSRAIFPKGFRSRVKYINILDPATMCHYISEVLDSGAKGPLFMVSLENCPREVFIHVTPTRCWEMVVDRVNQEITKLHKLGRMKLPPLQPQGCLDGLEMFGFSSPAIIQAIEALDKNRVCKDYWNSRPLAQVSKLLQPEASTQVSYTNSKDKILGGADVILKGLFKKANTEELHSLLGILEEEKPATSRSVVTKLLNEEIHQRMRQCSAGSLGAKNNIALM
ncbi:hypothetical protein V2J09_007946 [Rumex salicifolius]